ncbi:MAG TPA: hypothetical protein VD757_02705 [Candidatus Nitrosocosmicus sp.]|nr:hypothetical protein [Candidatus Nitrosocosmicus sp.]
MKKTCMWNESVELDLTVGKEYEIDVRDSGLYYITTDRDGLLCVSPERFSLENERFLVNNSFPEFEGKEGMVVKDYGAWLLVKYDGDNHEMALQRDRIAKIS